LQVLVKGKVIIMKSKLKSLLKRFLFLLLYSFILFAIAVGIGFTISDRFHYKLPDVLSYEGVILFFIGILASMKGNPSGISFGSLGRKNENAINFYNLEVTRREREIKPYYKDFLKNNVVQFAFSNLTLLLSGALLVALSLLLY
jgi:hypothetical protein